MPDNDSLLLLRNKKGTKKLTTLAPIPIEMIDHEGQGEEDNKAWCKNVMIGEYTIITGTNNVRFIVWTITVETLKNNRIVIRKRFNDFVKLREYLVNKYAATSAIEIPKLPAKSILLNFDKDFLEKRRNGLEFFLNSILLNPLFCNDEVIKQFITD